MNAVATKQNGASEDKEVIYIETETIMPNRAQPRTHFDAEGLNELAESIKKYGILQPLTVRKIPENSKFSHFQYELIAGERRLRAAKLLKMEKIPCILMKSDSKTSAVLAIIENLHRRDLNVFEEASAIASLIEIYHLTQEQIAAKLSMTQAAVANKLRLLKLSEEEKSLILSGKLTERHARALLRIKNPEERLKILHRILNSGLNVKQTEEIIEEKLGQSDIKQTQRAIRDSKSLIYTIERAIEQTRKGGTKIKTQQSETDTEIIYVLSISK